MPKSRTELTRRFATRDSKTSMPFDVLEYTRLTYVAGPEGAAWQPGAKQYKLAATGEPCVQRDPATFQSSISKRTLNVV